MTNGTLATDDELWERFGRQELVHAEWNHVNHLRIAYLHARRFSLDEAHLRLRAGIIRLNQRHQLEESPDRGYFETMTRVWLHLVFAASRSHTTRESSELLQRCPELLDRALPLRHYTKERLHSTRARAIFLDPDREPLPPLAELAGPVAPEAPTGG